MYVLVFYVPPSHLEEVKAALFDAGAGRYGKYDRACWEAEGTGQFRPLEGSNPFTGRVGTTERTVEHRVEMICEDSRIGDVLTALKRAHPYEEPAWHAWRVLMEIPGPAGDS